MVEAARDAVVEDVSAPEAAPDAEGDARRERAARAICEASGVSPMTLIPAPDGMQPDMIHPGRGRGAVQPLVFRWRTKLKIFDAILAALPASDAAPAQGEAVDLTELHASMLEEAGRQTPIRSMRMGLGIAARAIRRGRLLTPEEKLANFKAALAEWPDDPAPARTEPSEAEAAVTDVIAERRRQIESEGWSAEHDDFHDERSIALAAAAYAEHAARTDESYASGAAPASWPWAKRFWKPKDRRRDLVRAGALILAEIDRLDRAAAKARFGRV